MNAELTDVLKKIYPKGKLDEPCYDNVDIILFKAKVADALKTMMGTPKVRLEMDDVHNCRHGIHLIVTRRDDPPFQEWIWKYSNFGKISWIKENSRTYNVLHVNVSLIHPAFYHYMNMWHQRDDTEYLDAEIANDPPDELWQEIFTFFADTMGEQGFSRMTYEEIVVKVPFVSEAEYSEDEDKDEPDWIPTSIGQCIFIPQ